MAFASDYNWLIAGLVFLMGVVIRHYFNTVHARAGNPIWTWAVAAILLVLIMALSTVPLREESATGDSDSATSSTYILSPAQARFARATGFEQVRDIVDGQCSMCHAQAPSWQGMHHAPGGLHLENPVDIARHARAIYLYAGASRAMPPAGVMEMAPEDRQIIATWYQAAVTGP